MERGKDHEVPRTRIVTGEGHQGYQRGVEEVGRARQENRKWSRWAVKGALLGFEVDGHIQVPADGRGDILG